MVLVRKSIDDTSKSTASSLLETGGKEYFAFMPMKKGLTLLYQTYEFNMAKITNFNTSETPWLKFETPSIFWNPYGDFETPLDYK